MSLLLVIMFRSGIRQILQLSLCVPFPRIQEVLRNVFWGYSIDMDTKELSYEFVTLRYLQEKAQKVIWILGQTTMDAESLLQIQNNYSKNVTFAKLITYMEYGFYRREYHAAT